MSSSGVIVPAKGAKFAGRIFSVPKKDSAKVRIILDLSPLNKFIHRPSFKMTTTEDVRNLLPQGTYTASVDIKDAYWHIPIAKKFQSFLGFRVQDQFYHCKAIPFGLNIAPRIFTKIMSAAINQLRLRGISVVAYLDDLLIWAPSPGQLRSDLMESVTFLSSLGWSINRKKSNLSPSQEFRYLGIEWNTVSHSLLLPRDKVVSYLNQARLLLNLKKVKLKQLQSLAGSLNFASIASPLLKVKLKDLYRLINRFFKTKSKKSRPIPPDLRGCILSCTRLLKKAKSRPLATPPISLIAYTDASSTGWGFHYKEVRKRGLWSPGLKGLHINVLELHTILLLVKHLQVPPLSHIRVMCDNTTAVQVIQRGGSRTKCLNNIMFLIVKIAQSKQLFLSADYVQGCMNVIADKLSRSGPISTEWTLDQVGRAFIHNLVPPPQIDLFATGENTVLENFVSPVREAGATDVNALGLDWNAWRVIYLFPPINLILKVVIHLRSFQGTAYLITPWWPNRPWFGELYKRARRVTKLKSGLVQNTPEGITFAPPLLQENLVVWTI